MASSSLLSLTLLSLSTTILLVLTPHSQAQPAAPAPGPAAPPNIIGILDKSGQYTTFIRLLKSTQADSQINNQVNNSRDGMTIFAPTDNAFTSLPAGTLNNLTTQQQVQLVQYHILPHFYSLSDLETVPNPVRTQASGQDGRPFVLLVSSGQGNQVNVSSGLVETQVNNALRKDAPLAVYQLDKVLLPKEFTEAKAPAPAPPTVVATPSDTKKPTKSAAAEPAANAVGELKTGLGFVAGLGLLFMAIF